jgi:hypothetical protein
MRELGGPVYFRTPCPFKIATCSGDSSGAALLRLLLLLLLLLPLLVLVLVLFREGVTRRGPARSRSGEVALS